MPPSACRRGGSPALLTAIVLICSVLETPNLRDCNETNARAVMLVPEAFASPVTCAMHGQAYVAGTAIGRSRPLRTRNALRRGRSPANDVVGICKEVRFEGAEACDLGRRFG